MKSKPLNALNVIAVVCAFLIADAPNYIKMLAAYSRACVYIGVAVGVLSSFARLIVLLKSVLGPYSSSHDRSNPSAPIPPSVVTLALFVTAFLLVANPAQAQQDQPTTPQIGFNVGATGSCQLAAAVSALQVNLKTGDTKRIALLGGFGCTFNDWVIPYGATVYVGSGISSDEGTAPQANLLLQLSNWFAFGPGVQVVKAASGDRIFQGLLSFVGTLNFGGTPYYVKASADRAVRAAVHAP